MFVLDEIPSLTKKLGSDLPLEWPDTIAHRIDNIIAEYPNNIALKDGFGRSWTYSELDQRIESIAQALREKLPDQDKTQSVVGVFQSPSAHWIASMLAIFRIGAIYLPLDLKVSASRLKGYVETAQPAVILADEELAGQAGEIGVNDPNSIINVSELDPINSTERPLTAAKRDRAAYIIFTSGSTGTPKGIVVRHASFRTMMEGFVREWDIANHAQVTLQQFALTSDGSLKQIFSAISTGGCLFVAPQSAKGDPAELTRIIADHGVTLTVATPSEYVMWLRFAPPENLQRCTSWTSAWFGGERSPQSLLESFRNLNKILPNLKFYTTYGPTEGTISTMKGVADLKDVNIKVPVPGRPLPHYAVYILDDEQNPVPATVPGEIVIGGAGVGQNEYLGRPDITEKQFPADPFTTEEKRANGWGRMYRTGDYGRINNEGMLTIEGRVAGDAQVKVRGFRVELGEIESTILKEAAGSMANAIVTLRGGEDGDHDGLLAAHVVMTTSSESQNESVIANLRTRLNEVLPQYMVPAFIIPVKDLPMTAHGKVDRKAVQLLPLPSLDTLATETAEESTELTPTEQRLADIWKQVLPAHALMSEALGSKSDFFRAGGNSLLLVKLQALIRSVLGDAPRLTLLMNTPDLAGMAALLESSGAAPDWDKETWLDLLGEKGQYGKSAKNDNLQVLVTGATGSLGKHIVPHLAANPDVGRIVVLARPAEGRDLSNLFPQLGDKIRVVPTELPSLPTDKKSTALFARTDVIVHVAADRNFWDGYGAVKPVNVTAAKELAKLALRTGASLHVLSSGALANYEGDDKSQNLPRPDAAQGYISSKWVAERYLAEAARHTPLQVTVHRPSETDTAAIEKMPGNSLTNDEEDLIRSFIKLSPTLGVRPDFSGLGGVFHIALVDDVASSIAATATNTSNPTGKQMRIINYPGSTAVRASIASSYMDELLAKPENKSVEELSTVPVLHWVGKAKRAGLFKWFFTAQELVVTDDEGRKVVSRR